MKRRFIPRADFVIIDEVHRWHDAYENWLKDPEWANIPFVGLSATPWRKGLGKFFKRLITVSSTQALIEGKFLSPFRVFAPSHPDLSRIKTVLGDYHQGQLSERMKNPVLVADIVDTYTRFGEDRSDDPQRVDNCPRPCRGLVAVAARIYEFMVLGAADIWHRRRVEIECEFVLREPAVWLSEEMQRRCLGLPIIMEHPTSGLLDSLEFATRAVGTIVYSFVRDSDLMGVARILDAGAIEILKDGADTSPAVQFAPNTGARITIDDTPLLIEGDPQLLDHLAIVVKGVWTRSSAPGVENSLSEAA